MVPRIFGEPRPVLESSGQGLSKNTYFRVINDDFFLETFKKQGFCSIFWTLKIRKREFQILRQPRPVLESSGQGLSKNTNFKVIRDNFISKIFKKTVFWVNFWHFENP